MKSLGDLGAEMAKSYNISQGRYEQLLKACDKELKTLDDAGIKITPESVIYCYTAGARNTEEAGLMTFMAGVAYSAIMASQQVIERETKASFWHRNN